MPDPFDLPSSTRPSLRSHTDYRPLLDAMRKAGAEGSPSRSPPCPARSSRTPASAPKRGTGKRGLDPLRAAGSFSGSAP
jgi:hypothetical protein